MCEALIEKTYILTQRRFKQNVENMMKKLKYINKKKYYADKIEIESRGYSVELILYKPLINWAHLLYVTKFLKAAILGHLVESSNCKIQLYCSSLLIGHKVKLTLYRSLKLTLFRPFCWAHFYRLLHNWIHCLYH